MTTFATTPSRRRRSLAWPFALLALLGALAGIGPSGCIVVSKQRMRGHLADPIMAFDEDPLEARARRKFHSTREGSAGGTGEPAGGGCGCQ